MIDKLVGDPLPRICEEIGPPGLAVGVNHMFNGTIADEQEVVTACLDRLHLGQRQVVRSMTRSGLQVPSDGRMVPYLRENLEGLDEETRGDFLRKNREHHPIEPDLNPGGRLVRVGEEGIQEVQASIYHIVRGLLERSKT